MQARSGSVTEALCEKSVYIRSPALCSTEHLLYTGANLTRLLGKLAITAPAQKTAANRGSLSSSCTPPLWKPFDGCTQEKPRTLQPPMSVAPFPTTEYVYRFSLSIPNSAIPHHGCPSWDSANESQTTLVCSFTAVHICQDPGRLLSCQCYRPIQVLQLGRISIWHLCLRAHGLPRLRCKLQTDNFPRLFNFQ